jgi:hypothetical protein
MKGPHRSKVNCCGLDRGTFRLSLKAGQSSEIPLPAWRHTPPSLRRRRVRSGICANPATIRNSTLLFPANTEKCSLLTELGRNLTTY